MTKNEDSHRPLGHAEQNSVLLRAVTESTTDAVFVKDRKGRYLMINAAGTRMMGRTAAAEIVGRTDFDLFDAETARRIQEREERIMARGIGETYETAPLARERREAESPTEEQRTLLTTKDPYRSDAGIILGIVGLSRDITDRKKMEEAQRASEEALRDSRERLDGALSALREVVWSVDARTFDLVFLSPAVESVFGRLAGDFLEQPRLWLDVVHPQDQERLAVSTADLLWRGRDEREYRIVRPDGEIRWLRDRATLVRDAAGEMERIEGIATDITDEKRLQGQMMQAEKMAALGSLVMGVAHEINNPLAAISGTAQLLELHPDPQVQDDARAIRRMTERAERIVRSLRRFAHTSDSEARAWGDVNEAVQAMMEIADHLLRRGDVALSRHQTPGLPPVWMNDNQIQQVLLNLVSNAEYALRPRPVGERRLEIATALLTGEGDAPSVAVTVRDNGSGIPEAIRKRIFDPFFTTKDVGEGTGMGLSICHGIAVAHGGMLTVESEEGKGSAFTLTLPVKPPPTLL